jgi:hypothetical protein
LFWIVLKSKFQIVLLVIITVAVCTCFPLMTFGPATFFWNQNLISSIFLGWTASSETLFGWWRSIHSWTSSWNTNTIFFLIHITSYFIIVCELFKDGVANLGKWAKHTNFFYLFISLNLYFILVREGIKGGVANFCDNRAKILIRKAQRPKILNNPLTG